MLVAEEPFDALFDFYRDLFGWETLDDLETDLGRYRIFGKGGKAFGSFHNLPLEPEMIPEGMAFAAYWIYYVSVSDLVEAVARVVLHGGRVISGPTKDPTGARIAHCIDPQGAPFALREAKE